ncbi:MAG: hypothetical protein QFX33_02990 [Candidatus Nezhaarchaeota archaeon]|nr:hypothetical protein [Candidatus Nezhaarchaeota archaeon]
MSEEIIRGLSILAERSGKSIRTMINELLSEALNVVSNTDVKPDEAMKEYVMLSELKKFGFTVMPVKILNKLLNNNESIDLEAWREVGSTYGNIFKVKGRGPEELRSLLRVMLMDASDIALSSKGEMMEVVAVCPGRSRNACEALKAMLSGFMEAQGYEPAGSKVVEGAVIASFRRGGETEEKGSSSQ